MEPQAKRRKLVEMEESYPQRARKLLRPKCSVVPSQAMLPSEPSEKRQTSEDVSVPHNDVSVRHPSFKQQMGELVDLREHWRKGSSANWTLCPQRVNFPLPRELRDKIYHYLLHADYCSIQTPELDTTGSTWYRFETAILYTNRRIYQESKRVLYGDNDFVGITLDIPKNHFGPLAPRRIVTQSLDSLPFVMHTVTNGVIKPYISMNVHYSHVDGQGRLCSGQRHSVVIAARDLPHWCKFIQYCMILQIKNKWMVISAPDVRVRSIEGRTYLCEHMLYVNLPPAHLRKANTYMKDRYLEPLRWLAGSGCYINVPGFGESVYITKLQRTMNPKTLWLSAIGWSVVDLVDGMKRHMDLAASHDDQATIDILVGIYDILSYFEIAKEDWVKRSATSNEDWQLALNLIKVDICLSFLAWTVRSCVAKEEAAVQAYLVEWFCDWLTFYMPWQQQAAPPPHLQQQLNLGELVIGPAEIASITTLHKGHETELKEYLAKAYHILSVWTADQGWPSGALHCINAAVDLDPGYVQIQGDMKQVSAELWCQACSHYFETGTYSPLQHSTFDRKKSSLVTGSIITSNLSRLVTRPEGIRGLRDLKCVLSDDTLEMMGLSREDLED